MKPFQIKVHAGSFLVWSLLCFGHFYLKTSQILSGPHDGDLYAYSWSYQAVMFSIFRLPVWLLILGLVMILEDLYFSRRDK